MLRHRLFDRVREYAAFGDHRTGTLADKETIDWFADQIHKDGVTPAIESYTFDRFEGRAEIHLDGSPVEALPMFYSAVGTFANIRSRIVQLDVLDCNDDTAYEAICAHAETAQRQGEQALIVSTNSKSGELYAVNIRESQAKSARNFPVMLVPMIEGDQDRDASVNFSGRLIKGASASVIGRYGSSSVVPPLMITTPLSGWFTCAGERGAGIAIALSVAKRLAALRPIILIGTTGHEIGHLGAQDIVQKNLIAPTAPVLHIGSSVGAAAYARGSRAASLNRLNVICTPRNGAEDRLDSIMQHKAISIQTPKHREKREAWQGESEDWANAQRPMISIAGTGHHFHCKSDIPDTLDPELLDEAGSIVLGFGALLADFCHVGT